MSLELDPYTNPKMIPHKTRSASICVTGFPPIYMEKDGASGMGSGGYGASGQKSVGRTMSAGVGGTSSGSPRTSSANVQDSLHQSTPKSRMRKPSQGAHRSQSARVVGSQRPKIKRREQELKQQHLDLASSDGALQDCQDSYNPFLNKVPSTGRLIRNSSSLEMSQQSLHRHGTPPFLPSPHFLPNPDASTRDSPQFMRRHSSGGPVTERKGSLDPNIEREALRGKMMVNVIPAIATPEQSPQVSRKPSKPSGLPKSPQAPRSTSNSNLNSSSSTAKRANSMKNPRKFTHNTYQHGNKNTQGVGYLDVPYDQANQATSPQDEDEESYRLRTFSVTSKGIINRGDSFRRRKSRSNSLIPIASPEQGGRGLLTSNDGYLLPGGVTSDQVLAAVSAPSSKRCSPMPSPRTSPRPSLTPQLSSPSDAEPVANYRVAMLGSRGVGKSALISQFRTSESINAYDRPNDVEGEETISVMLNGEESELTFYKINNLKSDLSSGQVPSAFLLIYSVVDRASFQKVESDLRKLQEMDLIRTRAVVIVANKIDLARSRSVSVQDGRCLAVAYRVKFTEISVGINHNVDELLVGLLHQIRLKLDQADTGTSDNWYKHRGMVRASVKARQMLTWLLGKEDPKVKNCENLHIL